MEHSADINRKNKPGRSALHHAAWKGNQETVKTLIDLGADANALDGRELQWDLSLGLWPAESCSVNMLLH